MYRLYRPYTNKLKKMKVRPYLLECVCSGVARMLCVLPMPIYFVHGALCYSSLFKFFICLALPFKRVKLTSESVHVTQWSVWPKCVSKQAAETHMQTVTGESSGKSPPPKQPTKQTKVLAESDAKDIGPRKRKLSVSAQVNKPHINI